jgi:ribosomal protein S18 acetylase RimI-like enzyme
VFGENKIIIRELGKGDLKSAKKLQDFTNSLFREEAKILVKKELTLKDGKERLERILGAVRTKTMIFLVAEYDNKFIGTTSIELYRGRKDHVGCFGITIGNGYRRVGLGIYLMAQIIKLAKRELKPRPKIIKLEVFVNNKPAIGLYKKMGFKILAKIPKQIQWKGRLIDEYIMQKYL